MNVISLTNQKGGCGKTTTAVNLAYALTKKGRQVLLIDLDPQAHATFFLGINPEFTTADLLERVSNNEPTNRHDLLNNLAVRNGKLFVLPSSIGLSAAEHSLVNKGNRLEILKKSIEFLSDKFDYCIIDCPPNLGILTLNALVASHYAIVPFGVCDLSLKGVDNLNSILQMLQEHKNTNPQMLYLITQFDKRFRFSQSFQEKVKSRLGNRMLATLIRTNIHLREAASEGKSIFEYKNNSRGGNDHLCLAEEIERIVHRNKPDPAKETDNETLQNNEDLMKEIVGVSLSLQGKKFKEVFVVGEFNNWRKDSNFKLKKSEDDSWFITLPLKKGTYRYKFVADDQWINDPENPLEERDSFGAMNSVLFVK